MISVVVPCFNGGKRLAENLQKLQILLRETLLDWEIIVVDDASSDDSVVKIKELSERDPSTSLRVFAKQKNTGFGDTVDKGIRAAKGEIVFVLNATDLLPENSDYFKIMITHFELKKNRSFPKNDSSYNRVFSVGAAKHENGEIHGCGEIYFEKGFFLHGKGNPEVAGDPSTPLRSAQDSLRSAWSDGGSQALRRSYYLKIGGFDPLYKFYWEDVDLGWRAWKAGYQIDYEPRAVLLHARTEGPIAKYYSVRERRVMNLRNQMVFTYKNSDLKHLFWHCLFWPYHFLVALKNGDSDWFSAYWQAIFSWPLIMLARWKQKKMTKLTDDQVLVNFIKI